MVERHVNDIGAATFHSPAFAGVIDEHAPHHLGRRAIEMRATGQPRFAQAGEPQVGLVNKGRRLQQVTGSFVAKMPASEPAQLLVDQGEERLERVSVASAPPLQ